MHDRWTAVDAYLAETLLASDPDLEQALAASEAAGLPPISVSATHGKLLYLLAKLQGARKVLELGTLGGYSTLWLAKALPANGRVITLEADAKHAEVARATFAQAGLEHLIELRLGRALDTLPQLANEGAGPFDLIFITVHTMDCGGKRNQWFETTLQVWAPEGTSHERHMGVGKFLSIYRRVAAGVPIVEEATLRVEYGDVGSPAISYLVAGVETRDGEIVVKLEPPAVACKANARFVGDIPVLSTAAACCAPESSAPCCT
jgi:predicted O-methyltransferase YrrM